MPWHILQSHKFLLILATLKKGVLANSAHNFGLFLNPSVLLRSGRHIWRSHRISFCRHTIRQTREPQSLNRPPMATAISPIWGVPIKHRRVKPVMALQLVGSFTRSRPASARTELGKNIPAKFRESLSKCSAAHPKNALGRNISASLSQNLAECFYYTLYVGPFIWPILGRLTQSWSGYHNKDKFSCNLALPCAVPLFLPWYSVCAMKGRHDLCLP